LQDHSFLLGPMTADGLREAIVRPAASRGALFETGVVSALIKEMEQLPLLGHALDRLWRGRSGVWLTSAAYQAMGGVKGALAKHADECWARIPEADRVATRDLLLRLVSLGEGAPETSRKVALDALGANREQVDRVIQALPGLVVVDQQGVELAHDVL